MSARNTLPPFRLAAALRPVALLPAACVTACIPAQAATADIVVQWGDAVVTGAQALSTVLVPLAVTAAGAAAARMAGPLRFLVTTTLVERLVRNASDYALNAVAGAVRGKSLTIPLGSAVIARAVQRALDQAPAWLIQAAGGPAGIAEKIFRGLTLEEAANAGNTLTPGLDAALKRRSRV
ncbi:hypothetical protein [Methylobacterium sp. WL9]|uniref:hypothetical protein n=1 Tax=Methylobacterium sp. WL9 TaxID=2603898 RepID=UPI0011CB1E36|nr:hypothetical protein [Methylobacterium sp. WL9]TXN19348.1 hypothetical protein FV217_21735 [Methylobacterium sp. WL9]